MNRLVRKWNPPTCLPTKAIGETNLGYSMCIVPTMIALIGSVSSNPTPKGKAEFTSQFTIKRGRAGTKMGRNRQIVCVAWTAVYSDSG